MARSGGPFLMVLRNGSPIGPPIGPPVGTRGFSGFCRSRWGGCLAQVRRGAVLSPGPTRGAGRAVTSLHTGSRRPRGPRMRPSRLPRGRGGAALARLDCGTVGRYRGPRSQAPCAGRRGCAVVALRAGTEGLPCRAATNSIVPSAAVADQALPGGSVLLFLWAFAFALAAFGGLTHLPLEGGVIVGRFSGMPLPACSNIRR